MASPFWLLFADSIWRSGQDHGYHGDGSGRQRWMNYRDGITYEKVVKAAPSFRSIPSCSMALSKPIGPTS
jgi:hypothetical protein